MARMRRWSEYAHEKNPLWGPPQNVTDKDQKPEDHDQRVILHVTGLNKAKGPAHCLDKTADESDETIHDPAIPPTGTQRALNRAPRGAVHSAVDDLPVEAPQQSARILRAM